MNEMANVLVAIQGSIFFFEETQPSRHLREKFVEHIFLSGEVRKGNLIG